MKFKFNINQKVIHDGLVATIEKQWISTSGTPMYNLIADSDPELTCSAKESQCELYTNQQIDEQPALTQAYMESHRLQQLGESLTDKYFRDGNH